MTISSKHGYNEEIRTVDVIESNIRKSESNSIKYSKCNEDSIVMIDINQLFKYATGDLFHNYF